MQRAVEAHPTASLEFKSGPMKVEVIFKGKGNGLSEAERGEVYEKRE